MFRHNDARVTTHVAEGLVVGAGDDVPTVAAHETELGGCRHKGLVPGVGVAGTRRGFHGVGVAEVRRQRRRLPRCLCCIEGSCLNWNVRERLGTNLERQKRRKEKNAKRKK